MTVRSAAAALLLVEHKAQLENVLLAQGLAPEASPACAIPIYALQMIEYAGQVLRPIVADMRERRLYNDLVVSTLTVVLVQKP